MFFRDLGTASKRKKTAEGYLVVDAKIARTGVQEYDAFYDFAPGELPAGIPQEAGHTVRLLRPDEEVFAAEALSSFALKPITDGHPTEAVTAANVRDLQVGISRDTIAQDGDKIAAKLLIQVKDAIEKIERDGINQISAGYSTDIVWKSGVDERYGAFDGVQTNIRGNHIALVKTGRAGPEVRLSDKAKTNQEVKTMAQRKIDGITIDVTDQAGEVIDKLEAQVNDSRAQVDKLTSDLADVKSHAEKLKGELDAEKAKALDVKAIDELVKTRLAVIDDARKLHKEIEVDNKSETQIRTDAITAHAPDKFDLVSKSDEYIEAVFDTLVKSYEPKESKNLEDDLGNLGSEPVNIVDEARKRMREAKLGGK
jgi:hypothetical protein